MKVSVIGIGYVGTTLGVCLASKGHDVVGYEISEEKINILNSGKLHLFEPGLDELYAKSYKKNITFKSSFDESLTTSDVIFICVGTPSNAAGNIDLTQIKNVFSKLKEFKDELSNSAIIIRSTVPPGTTEQLLNGVFEPEQVFFVPEFLREGSAVSDFYDSDCIIGHESKNDKFIEKLNLLPNFENKKIVEYKTAEFLKYLNNTFHALKVAFSNEIGSLAHKLNINNEELFDSFFRDEKLNISKAYLTPGYAFGGSCLIKDVSAINHFFMENNIKNNLISSVLSSNESHINRSFDLLLECKSKKLCFYGVSFKQDTDDIRFSPIIKLLDMVLDLPSYKTIENITVCTNESSKDKIQKKYGDAIFVVSDLAEIPEDIDHVVWGAIEPTVESLSFFKNTKVFNLGYYSDDIFEEFGFDVFSIV